jgi:hypothetical protein
MRQLLDLNPIFTLSPGERIITELNQPLDEFKTPPEPPLASGTLLRETRSLDPETKQPCPARIVQRNGAVFIEKKLNSGKTQINLVERDADFYRRFALVGVAGQHRILNHFFM